MVENARVKKLNGIETKTSIVPVERQGSGGEKHYFLLAVF